MSEEIINRVAKSGIVTIELDQFLPPENNLTSIDIKDQLWQGLALKEKDFRTFIKENNWEQYKDKNVAVFCSVDAIIPNWAYMLIASSLDEYAKNIYFGHLNELENYLTEQAIKQADFTKYKDARVVIKGCGKKNLSPSIYILITTKLKPYVKSLMFGEPCSTVPVYKRKMT